MGAKLALVMAGPLQRPSSIRRRGCSRSEGADGVGRGVVADEVIQVFLVDDHAVVRDGLRASLERLDRIRVVGEAGTVAEAHEGMLRCQPDVAIVDVRLPDGSGVGLIRDVRSGAPHVRCIVFTSYADSEAFFLAMIAGASGFVLKDIDPDELRDAIETVAAGGSLVTQQMLDDLLAHAGEPAPEDELLAGFTRQERQILKLVSQGMTNREIAGTLSLAEKTVRNYMSNILAKVGMKNRTQLAAHVVRLSSPPAPGASARAVVPPWQPVQNRASG